MKFCLSGFPRWTQSLFTRNVSAQLTTAAVALALGLVALSPHRATASNLLINGDFEAGNTGFATDLLFKPGGFLFEAQYDTTTDPFLVHNFPGTYSYGDKTSGAGTMLVVNGPTISTLRVWSETVAVTQGTSYAFSGWVSSWRDAPFSNLRVSINDVALVDFWSPSTPATWKQFDAVWNSGFSTSAVIAVFDLSTDQGGNDFALDELSFAVHVPEAPTPGGVLVAVCVWVMGCIRRRQAGRNRPDGVRFHHCP